MVSRPAMAACIGLPATNTNNTITCDGTATDQFDGFNGLGGDDTITINGGTFGFESTNANGELTATGGQIRGGTQGDTINLNGGTMTDVISDDGIDTINLGTINPDGTRSGNALIRNSLRGSNDKDYINLYSGRVGKGGSRFFVGNVHSDNGDDEILLDGAYVLGTVFGGLNDDILMMKSGTVVQSVWGQDGIDKITIGDPSAPDAAGPTIGGAVDGGTENDLIAVISGKMASVTGGAGVDRIWLYGGEVTGAVDGAAGMDTIILGGAVGENELVPPNSPLRGTPTIGSNVQSISGGADNDTITLTSGTIRSAGDAVSGGAGNDTITLSGLVMSGRILGGADADTFNIVSGSTVEVDGGTGADTFYLSGGNVTGSVIGGDGDDQINLGMSETFSLTNGTTIEGDVLGGTGNDFITWWSGPFANSINGGDGSDTVRVEATSGYDGGQLLDGGDDTGSGDGYIDTLTITGKTLSLAGSQFTNWERIDLAGGGLTLTNGAIAVGDLGPNAMGMFLTRGAYMQSGAALDLNGNLNINPGSSLGQLAGNAHRIRGQLNNGGTINLQDGDAGDVLSVGGIYTGGGQLLVDINGDLADRMTIGGSVFGLPTEIVTRAIGDGTTGVPIEVVRVAGSTVAGDFTASDFDLGAYSYSLQLDGNVWQFVPAEVSDGGTLYPTVGGLLSLFANQTISTHFQRSGSWSRARATGEDNDAANSVLNNAGDGGTADGNVWLRGIGQWAEGEGSLSAGLAAISDQQISYDRNIGGIQGGVDFIISESSAHLLTLGLFGQAGQISGSAENETLRSSAGSADADAWGFGATLGLDTAEYYSEVVGGLNFYDIATRTNPGVSGTTQGEGYFLSLEAGREFAYFPSVSVIPQAQLAWIGTDIDSFTDGAGSEITFQGEDIALARLGLALDAFAGTFEGQPLRLTGIVNYWQQYGDAAQTSVAGSTLSLEQAGGSIEAGAGFHWGKDDAPLHLHGELTYRETVNGDGEQAWNGTLGARIAF